jgi:hypothetical protein
MFLYIYIAYLHAYVQEDVIWGDLDILIIDTPPGTVSCNYWRAWMGERDSDFYNFFFFFFLCVCVCGCVCVCVYICVYIYITKKVSPIYTKTYLTSSRICRVLIEGAILLFCFWEEQMVKVCMLTSKVWPLRSNWEYPHTQTYTRTHFDSLTSKFRPLSNCALLTWREQSSWPLLSRCVCSCRVCVCLCVCVCVCINRDHSSAGVCAPAVCVCVCVCVH